MHGTETARPVLLQTYWKLLSEKFTDEYVNKLSGVQFNFLKKAYVKWAKLFINFKSF